MNHLLAVRVLADVIDAGRDEHGEILPDIAALAIASLILAENTPSSRLYKALVETKKASNIGGGNMQQREAGLGMILAEVRKESSLDDARNTLTLSGTGSDIGAMLDAISVFDADVMKGMSVAIVPVVASQPDAMIENLRTIFGSDKEGPMSSMVRFIPNLRTKSILVISPQQTYLTRAERWIRTLDAKAQGAEKQLFTYSVRNRAASELVEIIESMFSSSSRNVPQGGRNVAPRFQQIFADAGLTPESFLEIRMSSLRQMTKFGIRLISGDDAGIGPDKAHGSYSEAVIELEQVTGTVPALIAASSHAAAAIGLGRSKGRLRRRYDADVLVVGGDLAGDLTALRHVRQVVLRRVPVSPRSGQS